VIRLVDVTITRGPNPVVDGLTVDLEPGAIFWVVGPNGAGKTSLLRVLAGVDPPRRGTLERDGPDLLYFQSEMTLPASATVGSWERLVRRLSRSGGASERAGRPSVRAGRPSGRTPLWPDDVEPGRRVSRLSTGQRKRLLLDALLREEGPAALDEPFEHLSPGAKADLATLLERRAERYPVVVATNQQPEGFERTRGIRLEAGLATELPSTGAPSGEGWQ
jgi:ABC-type multidrug transport system ATPase subunit